MKSWARFIPVVVLVISTPFLVAQTRQSLREAALTTANKMPKGGIVTAEYANGSAEYAAAGQLRDDKSLAPEQRLFEIGSITKVFTGLLLAQTVVEGGLTLDANLKTLLGKDMNFDDPKVGEITLKQLATHTSGLPRLPANLSQGSAPGDPYARYDRKLLWKALAKVKLKGDAPYDESYSNLGMGLLGEILAIHHGTSWEDLVKKRVTVPLGLSNTAVTLNEEQAARLTQGYEKAEKKQHWTFQALAGAGALRSTAEDMVKFGQAILEPDKTPFPEAIRLLLKPHSPDGNMGLCVFILKLDDQVVFDHDGGTGGFRTVWQVCPEAKTIRVVLSSDASVSGSQVLALARGAKPRTKESGRTLNAEELARYTGVYVKGPHRFTVVAHEGKLWFQAKGQPYSQIFPHEENDRFFLKTTAAEVLFTLPGDSGATVALLQNGRNTRAKKNSEPAPKIIFRSGKELAPYVGTYVMGPGAEMIVTVRRNTLYAKLTGQEAVPVFEKDKDVFEYDIVEATLKFARDSEGKLSAVVLHQNGLEMPALKK